MQSSNKQILVSKNSSYNVTLLELYMGIVPLINNPVLMRFF